MSCRQADLEVKPDSLEFLYRWGWGCQPFRMEREGDLSWNYICSTRTDFSFCGTFVWRMAWSGRTEEYFASLHCLVHHGVSQVMLKVFGWLWTKLPEILVDQRTVLCFFSLRMQAHCLLCLHGVVNSKSGCGSHSLGRRTSSTRHTHTLSRPAPSRISNHASAPHSPQLEMQLSCY